MKSDEIKNLFTNVVERSKSKYKFSLSDLAIMDNSIQLIIKPQKKESLSKIMQWILSAFAMNYNIYKLEGHVWEGHYLSKILV